MAARTASAGVARRAGAAGWAAWSRRLGVAAVVLLTAVHLVVFFVTMFTAPLGFDEAFMLQAPLNLVSGGGYASDGWQSPEPVFFDPVLSTGPVLELPIAVSFALFGVSIESARIVALPFFLLLLGSLVVLGRRAAGWWGAAAALGILLALNGRAQFPATVIYGPSDALGEYPAAALIALGLVLLPRQRLWAAFAFGLAVLTKNVALIALLGAFVAVLLVPSGRAGAARRVGRLAAFVGVAAIPGAAWEVVKLVSLGWPAYKGTLRATLGFFLASGSGASGGGFGGDALGRADDLMGFWQWPSVWAWVIWAALVVLAAVGLIARARVRTDGPTSRGFRAIAAIPCRLGVDTTAFVVVSVGWVAWWTLVSSSFYPRHTFPLVIVTASLAAAWAVAGIGAVARRSRAAAAAATLPAAGLAAAVVVAGIAAVAAAGSSPLWTRADQEAAAAAVRELGVDEVQGIGWWSAPAVRFLSGIPSTPIGTGDGPLVLEPIVRELAPNIYAEGLAACDEVLYERDGFVICTVRPGVVLDDFGFPR